MEHEAKKADIHSSKRRAKQSHTGKYVARADFRKKAHPGWGRRAIGALATEWAMRSCSCETDRYCASGSLSEQRGIPLSSFVFMCSVGTCCGEAENRR